MEEARPASGHHDPVAYAILTAMAICFGGTWVAGAVAVEAAPAFTVAAVRFAVASVLLLGWALVSRRRLSPLRLGDWPLVVGLGVTAIAGYNWLFLTGLTLAPASDGAIIVPGTAPILATLLAGIFLGERLGLRGFLGFGLALGGLLLVVRPTAESSESRLLGDLFFLLGAAFWAVYAVLARIARRRFSAVSTTLYGTAVGTLILIPLAIVEGGLWTLPGAPAAALAGIGYLALFGTVGAFVLFNLGVARIGVSRTAPFALLVPVVGVISSVILLGEELGPLTLVGGVIVLAGLWVVESRGAERPKPQLARGTQPVD